MRWKESKVVRRFERCLAREVILETSEIAPKLRSLGLDWADVARAVLMMGGEGIGKNQFFFPNLCKFLAGSFSAVSKRKLARYFKYAFDSIL